MVQPPLSYLGSQCVLQYMDPNHRFALAARCPGLRGVHKVTPLIIDQLVLRDTGFVLNGIEHSFLAVENGETQNLNTDEATSRPRYTVHIRFRGNRKLQSVIFPAGYRIRVAFRLHLANLLNVNHPVLVNNLGFVDPIRFNYKITARHLTVTCLVFKTLESMLHPRQDLGEKEKINSKKFLGFDCLAIKCGFINVPLESLIRLSTGSIFLDCIPIEETVVMGVIEDWIANPRQIGTRFSYKSRQSHTIYQLTRNAWGLGNDHTFIFRYNRYLTQRTDAITGATRLDRELIIYLKWSRNINRDMEATLVMEEAALGTAEQMNNRV